MTENNMLPSTLYILFEFLEKAEYPNVYWNWVDNTSPYREMVTDVCVNDYVIGKINITVDLLAEAATIEVFGEMDNSNKTYKCLFNFTFFNDVKEHMSWYSFLKHYSHNPYRRHKTKELKGKDVFPTIKINLKKDYDEFLTEIEKIAKNYE